MHVIVAGSGELGGGVLAALLGSGHVVAGLLQNGRTVRGAARAWAALERGLLGAPIDPLRLAARRRVPVVWVDKQDAAELDVIRALRPDLIITCGFSIILHAPLLAVPSAGCVNVHSSLLPKHRGPNPFSRVILAGERETGVTWHVTVPDIDSGDILEQRAFPVGPRDTVYAVYERACAIASANTSAVVDRIERDGLAGRVQPRDGATYEPKLSDEELRIRWERSAEEIDRLIRAGHPFADPYFVHRARRIRVIKAAPIALGRFATPGTVLEVGRSVAVATGEGAIRIETAYGGPKSWPLRWPGLVLGPRIGEVLE
ncbi:MAG: methionyl-tRNA formyltransferase [Candidatus Hydrogenedentota bacterium]